MKLPTAITIRGVDYTIEYVAQSAEVPTVINCEDKKYLGYIDYNSRTIRVCTEQPNRCILESLIHELIHGVLDRNPMLLKEVVLNEEAFVDGVAIEIVDLLVENNLITEVALPELTKRIV
jgi:hypothetical protein